MAESAAYWESEIARLRAKYKGRDDLSLLYELSPAFREYGQALEREGRFKEAIQAYSDGADRYDEIAAFDESAELQYRMARVIEYNLGELFFAKTFYECARDHATNKAPYEKALREFLSRHPNP